MYDIHPFEEAWLALGKFTFEFADAEDTLRELVIEYAGGGMELNKILLDSARVAALISRLRRLAEMKEQDLPLELDGALKQLAVLSDVRNLLFHHGPRIGDRSIEISTYLAKGRIKGETFTVTSDELFGMANDLQTIKWIIRSALNPAGMKARAKTWSYKRPQPKTIRQPRDDSDREFRHPLAPLPE